MVMVFIRLRGVFCFFLWSKGNSKKENRLHYATAHCNTQSQLVYIFREAEECGWGGLGHHTVRWLVATLTDSNLKLGPLLFCELMTPFAGCAAWLQWSKAMKGTPRLMPRQIINIRIALYWNLPAKNRKKQDESQTN